MSGGVVSMLWKLGGILHELVACNPLLCLPDTVQDYWLAIIITVGTLQTYPTCRYLILPGGILCVLALQSHLGPRCLTIRPQHETSPTM